MSLTLYVDGARLRSHLVDVADRFPDLVPVVRGNGSGLGTTRLALEASHLGADTIAVGTSDECDQVAHLFTGDLLVLTPWRPFAAASGVTGERVVHTISRLEDLDALLAAHPAARLVLARMTSTRLHGLSARELRAAAHRLADLGAGTPGGPRLEGVLLSFPIAGSGRLTELHRLGQEVAALDLPTHTLWVANLGEPELLAAYGAWPDLQLRPLLGDEALWLNDQAAFSVRAHVLDLHRLERGSTFGEYGRTVPRRGHLLVVSGGMAHGIGLEPPTADLTLKARATSLARGSLDAAGLVRSPYVVDGKQRYFAEPPHSQAPLVYLPEEARVPAIGDEVELRVRFSTTSFDRTVVS